MTATATHRPRHTVFAVASLPATHENAHACSQVAIALNNELITRAAYLAARPHRRFDDATVPRHQAAS